MIYILSEKPTEFKAALSDFNKVILTWKANAESDLHSYQLYRKELTDTVVFLLDSGIVTSTFADTTQLEYQRFYEYTLSATDTIGNVSELTKVVVKTGDKFAPDTVRNLTATVKPVLVSLTWDKNNEKDIWKYRIYRKGISTDFSLIKELTNIQNSYEDSTVQNGASYSYAVSAVDSTDMTAWDPAYESAWSSIVNVTIPDVIAPAKPVITTVGSFNKEITLAWSQQNEPDLRGFRIFRSNNNVDYSLIDSVSKSTFSYSDRQVLNFQQYQYYVCAVDTNNNVSEPSNKVTGAPFNKLPKIKQLKDTVIHNSATYLYQFNIDLEGSQDTDGQIEKYNWFVEGELAASTRTAILTIPQGTHSVKAVIIDNDGGKDSTEFNVSIDAGYYKYQTITDQNAGITVIGKEYIFVPEAGGKMQVLDFKFRQKIDVSIAGEINSVSSVSLDTIMYLSSSFKTIFSFNKKGISLWSLPLGGDLKATPTIDMVRNLIFVGVSNYNIFAIDRTSGKVTWSYRTDSPITQPGVIIGKDLLLIMTENGKTHIFDLNQTPVDNELSPSLTVNLNTKITTAPAIDKDGNLYLSTTNGRLIKYYYDKSIINGNILWTTSTNSVFKTSPVIGYDGTVYIGAEDSKLYAFNGDNGQEKWSLTLDGAISSTITINENGVLYIGTTSGKLYCISETGKELWSYKTSSAIANATAYIDGHILFSNQSGELYKINDAPYFMKSPYRITGLEGAINKKPQWGTYQGNNRRSGAQAESFQFTKIEHTIINGSVKVYDVFSNVKVEIELPEESLVTIQIYDLNGNRV